MNQRKNTQQKISPAWITDSSDPEPVVLSTRVRLARNLEAVPFPHLADIDTLRRVAQSVLSIVTIGSLPIFDWFRSVQVSELSETDKSELVDSHMVSLMHVLSGPHRFALLDDAHSSSIMINEEDHIRIQSILPGLMPHEAWQEADKIDDVLSSRLHIAFDETYGYLTSSLANAGTGMRASVMVHLPALAFLERLEATWHAAHTLGATVRGLYGEDGASQGHVYQISNGTSVGNEKGLIGRLTAVATFLQSEETVARHILRTRRKTDMELLVETSLQKLKSATALSVEEAMCLLSHLRLGELLGIPTGVSHRMFCEMMITMRGSVGSIASKKNRARDVFYEDTRRPASLRNRMRQERTAAKNARTSLGLPY